MCMCVQIIYRVFFIYLSLSSLLTYMGDVYFIEILLYRMLFYRKLFYRMAFHRKIIFQRNNGNRVSVA